MFTKQELQFLLDASDTMIRQHGLKVAGIALQVATKLQAIAEEQPKKEEEKDESGS